MRKSSKKFIMNANEVIQLLFQLNYITYNSRKVESTLSKHHASYETCFKNINSCK